MCSASRLVVYETDSLASFLLSDVAELIEKQWMGLKITHLLRQYDTLRTSSDINSTDLAALALAAPQAIDELRDKIGCAPEREK